MNYLVDILIIVLVGLGVAVGFVISLFEDEKQEGNIND